MRAVITGGTRGIGLSAAAALGKAGYDIIITGIDKEASETALKKLEDNGIKGEFIYADSMSEEDVNRCFREISRKYDSLDVLVNNAGIAQQTLFQDTDDAAWSRMLAVNLTGPRNTVMAALPHMLTEKRGCVVNVSSIWGLRGSSCETAYAASKAGLIGLTRSLALELAPSGIRVNAVAPGCIATDMVRALGTETRAMLEDETPMGRLGTPEEIAKAVCFLASDSASFITGQTLTIDGGFIV